MGLAAAAAPEAAAQDGPGWVLLPDRRMALTHQQGHTTLWAVTRSGWVVGRDPDVTVGGWRYAAAQSSGDVGAASFSVAAEDHELLFYVQKVGGRWYLESLRYVDGLFSQRRRSAPFPDDADV